MFKFPNMRRHEKREYRKRSPGDIEFMIDSYRKQKLEICSEIDRKIGDLTKMLAKAKEETNE